MGKYIINTDSFEYRTSTNDILKALISEAQWLLLLRVSVGELNSLIDVILRESKKSDSDEYKALSVKSISIEIGVTSSKVSKLINQLYIDVCELNLEKPELFFPDSDFGTFYFKDGYGKQYAYFNLGLSQTINVGDNFSWSFLSGKFSSTTFYVESIDHEHKKGILKTSVNLKLGYFNSYRHFLLDKSSFLNLIDLNEMLTLSDYKIDELLYHRVENKKDGFPDSMAKEANYFEKMNRRRR